MKKAYASLFQPWSPLALGIVGCLMGCLVCALIAQIILSYVPAPMGPKHPHQAWELMDRMGIALFSFVALPINFIVLISGTSVERRGSKIVGVSVTEDSIVFLDESVRSWMLVSFCTTLIANAWITTVGIIVVKALASSIS